MDRYVPDLQSDPFLRTLSRLFGLWAVLGLLIPTLLALAVTQSWLGALMGFIWGGLMRVFLVHPITWSVNSICHLWGSQPFNTHDYSRNNASFGIPALGEGWHHTHHASRRPPVMGWSGGSSMSVTWPSDSCHSWGSPATSSRHHPNASPRSECEHPGR